MKINPQIVATMIFGSLAGSVFTWYINRPQNTVLTYAITTTTLGADATAKGLIPDLKIQINGEDIPVVHTHIISIEAQRGPYLESADVAVMFDAPIRVYGKLHAEAPSPLQRVDCTDVDRTGSVTCKLSRLAPHKGQYRIAIATDRRDAPRVVMVAKNADVLKADVYLENANLIFGIPLETAFSVVLGLFIVVFGLTVELREAQRRKVKTHKEEPCSGSDVAQSKDVDESR